MATPQALEGDRWRLRSFVGGLARTQRWMAAASASEIAAVLAPTFPEIDAPRREWAVQRYLRQGTWAPDPRLTRAGFEALQASLLGGGLIAERQLFDDLVDTSLVAEAMG